MSNFPKTSLQLLLKLNYLLLILGLWGILFPPQVSLAQPTELVEEENTDEGEPKIDQEKERPEFGEKGSKRWYIQGATAIGINEELGSPLFLGGAGISEFILNGHSINLELNKIAVFQDGDDAIGLNLAFLMRWHFYRAENWSVFVDGGVGIVGTTNEVPSSGSSLNFTPQVGGGTTIRLKNDRRLFLGIRWHHISNGDIYENNPGRDSVMGYVGWNLPR